MLKSILKWFATKKGESAAKQVNKQLENDPEYQKSLDEFNNAMQRMDERNKKIDGLMDDLIDDTDDENDENKG